MQVRNHKAVAYPVALALIGLPSLLHLGESHPAAFWLSTATGVAAFVLTLLTDHETGVIRVLPYKFHLAVDFSVAIVFLAATFTLGFQGIDAGFYLANAIAVLTVVGLHKPAEKPEPAIAAT